MSSRYINTSCTSCLGPGPSAVQTESHCCVTRLWRCERRGRGGGGGRGGETFHLKTHAAPLAGVSKNMTEEGRREGEGQLRYGVLIVCIILATNCFSSFVIGNHFIVVSILMWSIIWPWGQWWFCFQLAGLQLLYNVWWSCYLDRSWTSNLDWYLPLSNLNW